MNMWVKKGKEQKELLNVCDRAIALNYLKDILPLKENNMLSIFM